MGGLTSCPNRENKKTISSGNALHTRSTSPKLPTRAGRSSLNVHVRVSAKQNRKSCDASGCAADLLSVRPYA